VLKIVTTKHLVITLKNIDMNFYTLSFSAASEGFPSFYSFGPDRMIGMNNYFYSFSGGDLYRHNTGPRANYYGKKGLVNISSVFNKSPLEAKLFKTLELHSDSAWEVINILGNTPRGNFQVGANITSTDFEEKEGVYYSYIRNDSTADNAPIPQSQLGLRSVKGIGECGTVSLAGTNACVVPFSVDLSSMISVGDFLYQPTTNNIGQITAINHETNEITVDNSVAGLSAPADNTFTFFVKSSSIESHGVIGQFLEFTIQLPPSGGYPNTELFAVTSDIMKSYP
tara:strand:+ start:2587 stop:3435 length:849 start_codon:yes stop_codon:yes gene_type:complete